MKEWSLYHLFYDKKEMNIMNMYDESRSIKSRKDN